MGGHYNYIVNDLFFVLYGHYNAKLDRGVHATVFNRDMYCPMGHLHFLFITLGIYKTVLSTRLHTHLKIHWSVFTSNVPNIISRQIYWLARLLKSYGV